MMLLLAHSTLFDKCDDVCYDNALTSVYVRWSNSIASLE